MVANWGRPIDAFLEKDPLGLGISLGNYAEMALLGEWAEVAIAALCLIAGAGWCLPSLGPGGLGCQIARVLPSKVVALVPPDCCEVDDWVAPPRPHQVDGQWEAIERKYSLLNWVAC